jgi:hypothetical protein
LYGKRLKVGHLLATKTKKPLSCRPKLERIGKCGGSDKETLKNVEDCGG